MAKVLVLRDNLVISYKALVAKIRQKASKEIDRLPDALLRKFASAWHAWELPGPKRGPKCGPRCVQPADACGR